MRIRNSNRVAITLRFNLEEQDKLRQLCDFWGGTEKDILRLAVDQLAIGTKQIIQKKEAANEVDIVDSVARGLPSAESDATTTTGTAPDAG